MIRITKETDYATMLLAFMAEQPLGEVHSAREMAERSGLSIPMVSKILRLLTRGDLVTSHRGVGGGYSLRRPASSIAVAEVVRAVEGPISMVQCGTSPGTCEHESVCPSRINWAQVSRRIETALEQVTVAELVGPPACGAGLLDLTETAPSPGS